MTHISLENTSLTAFLTVAGIDLVLRTEDTQHRREHRGRATYEKCETFINGVLAKLELTDDDNVINVELGDLKLKLTLQPRGHYFTWLRPIEKAEPCNIEQARKLMRTALRNKTKTTKPE